MITHLKHIRALLAVAWTQFARAEDANHQLTSYDAHNAAYFCMLGGIYYCVPVPEDRGRICDLMQKKIGRVSVWNDAPNRTLEDVLMFIDVLISEQRGPVECTEDDGVWRCVGGTNVVGGAKVVGIGGSRESAIDSYDTTLDLVRGFEISPPPDIERVVSRQHEGAD